MKIIINPNETYDIKLPEVIDAEKFIEILNQFDNIAKIIKINSITGTNIKNFKTDFQKRENGIAKSKYDFPKKRINTISFFDNREKVLDILQYHYYGTKTDKERIAKIIDMKWVEISKRFHSLIFRYDIQPNEIGLINLGNKNNQGRENRIPNYIIKSYTGIFDENGN